MFLGRPLTGFNQRFHTYDPKNYVNVEGQMFEQILDHFDPENNVTWKQQYWNNMEFSKPSGPQFLIMGQESEGSSADVIDPLQTLWAKNVSAGIWSLEHRFYGKSQPFKEQTVENMKYLSSRQYLGDVANFIRTQNRNLNLTNPKWIVFGGSYAGALALWFRELYPELAIGAVGSSAPIQPVLDFYEYNQIVENSIRHRDPKCAKNIKIAFKQLGNLMEYIDGRDELNIIFKDNLAMLNITSDEIEDFYMDMIEMFEERVQYDCIISCNFGIKEICKMMNMPSSNKAMNLGLIHSGSTKKYNNMVDFLNYTLYENLSRAAMRSWFWQTCNEFGFYSSTSSGNSFFGSKVPLNYYIDLCMDVFGDEFNVDHIEAGIANTLKFYGGIENYNGTNVIAPRGSIDPWSALALKTSNDPSVIPYLINEGSHCSDMAPPTEFDSETLRNLRSLILQNIKKWICISPINNATTDIGSNGKQKKLFASEIGWKKVANYKPSNRSQSFRTHKLLHQKRLRENLYKNAKLMEITENRISQPLDHFNKTDAKIWNQRFWNNSAFYKEDGPLFLMIGGEDDGGAHLIDNENSPFLIWAKQYGADTYFIEHRGYGGSLPTNTSTVENLKYISSEQALADISNFIEAINLEKNQPNAKWITFGGSYPGTLSAIFREKYPQLTAGAVASSAPMLPKIDFFEYSQVVENVFYENNPKCGDNLKAAFTDLGFHLYSIEGRKIIKKLFNISLSGKSPEIDSIYDFLDGLLDNFYLSVQYGSGVEIICKIMLNDDNTPLENLASITHVKNEEEKFVEKDNENSWNFERSWIWQTCTEFGWYQTTDMGRNIFGSAVPVGYYINDCIQEFGKNITDIAAGVDYTLQNYGGVENYNATNIVFVNGSHDPWHPLSIYTNNTEPSGITSILINGTSHCRDMDSPNENDSAELKAARQKIGELIEIWLK